MTEIDPLERLRTALADRHEVEQELGHGGMAIAYLARDLKHDRMVAIKVMRPDLAAAIGSERFLREIAIEAKLSHPHILPLYDSGPTPEPVAAMAAVADPRGVSAAALYRFDRALTAAERIAFMKEIAVSAAAEALQLGEQH